MSKITMTRRATLAGIAGLGAVALLPGRALAVTAAQAEALIDKVVRDINKIIASGKSERAMIRDFEKVFVNYADVGRIAMMVLGPDGRAASASQKRAFTKAFQGYVGRKYGKRFREFIGGRVEVQKSRAVKSFFEVTTMTGPGAALSEQARSRRRGRAFLHGPARAPGRAWGLSCPTQRRGAPICLALSLEAGNRRCARLCSGDRLKEPMCWG